MCSVASSSLGRFDDHLRSGSTELVDSQKQVPSLRIAIDKANRNAPVGMTGI